MHTKSKVLVGSIKKGNSSTISLTVELFPIYAFELFPICAIRTIYTIPLEAICHEYIYSNVGVISNSKYSHPCNSVMKFLNSGHPIM